MKDLVSFKDFSKLDLRVGTIKKVEVPSGSEHVYRLTVDFGEEIGERTIFAGFKNHYSEDELKGKQGVFVINIEPRKMMGEESEGMMLAADVDGKPIPLQPIKKVPEGSIVR